MHDRASRKRFLFERYTKTKRLGSTALTFGVPNVPMFY